MYSVWPPIALCIITAFILGARLAYWRTAKRFQQKLDEQFREFLVADTKSWAIVSDLRKKLAKFDYKNQPRGCDGKFTKRQ